MAKKRFKIIYLELTNACNFTCDYCPIDQQTRAKQVMPQSFAENIIDQIADAQLTDFLTFHVMGEPYMHKNLCELTGYAEERGLRVRLLTNGSLLEDVTSTGSPPLASMTQIEDLNTLPLDCHWKLPWT